MSLICGQLADMTVYRRFLKVECIKTRKQTGNVPGFYSNNEKVQSLKPFNKQK